MTNMSNKAVSRLQIVATTIGMILVVAFMIYGFRIHLFTDSEVLKAFLRRYGIWAPIVFVAIQAIQVVVPILPGSAGCLVGVMVFGPFVGFLYNYIGICIGSVWAFLLARKYGKPLVIKMSNVKTYNKYIKWIERDQKFEKLFALAIFLPVAPDDFLCYLAGISDIKVRNFVTIILLGKPCAIFLYSCGLSSVSKLALSLIR